MKKVKTVRVVGSIFEDIYRGDMYTGRQREKRINQIMIEEKAKQFLADNKLLDNTLRIASI